MTSTAQPRDQRKIQIKNRMSSSSGAYFHQSCHVTKACVSLNWHPRRQTCRVLRRESWRSVCFHQQCAAAVVYSPWCISATSVKFPLRKCGKWWRIRLSKFRSWQKRSEGRRLKIGEWSQLELRTPCEKFLATPLHRMLYSCIRMATMGYVIYRRSACKSSYVQITQFYRRQKKLHNFVSF